MSRGLLVDNGASEVTMETMERKTKVATVKMERMKGPEGRLCHGRAQQGWQAEAAQRSRQRRAQGRGHEGPRRGGRELRTDGRWIEGGAEGGERALGCCRPGSGGSGRFGMVLRERVSDSRCQGRRRRSLQTQAPEGSTAAAAAGVGTSRQPRALCVSMGMNRNKKLQV